MPLVAGMWEMWKNNSFAAVAFMSYGVASLSRRLHAETALERWQIRQYCQLE